MSAPAALPLRHTLLALAVVAVWGSNFVVIKLGLAQLPPLLFAALRFALAAFPLALFMPRPPVRWRNLAAYGLAIGLGTFGLLFLAMTRHISPGLASLVIQAQVFFTIGLVMWQAGERPRPFQAVAMAVAAAGMGLIIARTEGDTTAPGVALVLLAALCWALGNLASRAAGPVNALAYVAWSSLFAAPPLLGLSLWLEGAPRIGAALASADAAAWAAVLWQALGNTIFGYGAWAWLMARHPAASIAPFALLVPVTGIGASAWLLGEALPGWKLAAAALVLAGLALNVLWPRVAARWRRGV
ncbi:EamA family transporter [Comamonadaceae bacterium OH2545_COT-014]|nr:EamA family transporter [Comamonadaceae bacterium OH2545_COT-014]